MPCCGGGGAAEENEVVPNTSDKNIPETSVENTGIEDIDKVFEKNDIPLSTIIGLNNTIQGAVEQLFAAGSALFGGNITEASITDGKLSFEIFKPPEKKDDKKKVIAVVTGKRTEKEPTDKGIDIKDKELWKHLESSDDLKIAIVDANVQIMKFNLFIAKPEFKAFKFKVENNRLKVDTKKPANPEPKKQMKELETFNKVIRAVNNFNTTFFPVKSNLMKQAFKDGLNIKLIIKTIMDKLKETLGAMVPTVKLNVEALMAGDMNFVEIAIPDFPGDINDFLEASELLPPMFKKAWSHIAGKGGFIDCCKACAAKLKELPGQVKDAIEAFKDLPQNPDQIKEAGQNAVKSGKLGMMDAPKVPKKMKANSDQLARLPKVLEDFMKNLKATLQEFADAFVGGASDAMGPGAVGAVGTVGAVIGAGALETATTAVIGAATADNPTETPKENGETKPDSEEKTNTQAKQEDPPQQEDPPKPPPPPPTEQPDVSEQPGAPPTKGGFLCCG
jgi:hypothetical protein